MSDLDFESDPEQKLCTKNYKEKHLKTLKKI